MHNSEIHELNKALKGEYMASEGFDHYIQDTKDEQLRKELMDIQQQHKFHAIQIAERIQQLGGNPGNSSGVTSAVSEVWYKISPKKYIDNNVVKSAIEGEKIGLEAYGEILSKVSTDEDKELVKEMMSDCAKILEKLNTFM